MFNARKHKFSVLKHKFNALKHKFHDLEHKMHFDRIIFGVSVFSLGEIFFSVGVIGITRSPLYN